MRTTLQAALLFLLALSVLSWGTAYKTSLYRAPELGRAPAKLCTRASDSSRKEVERAVDELAPMTGMVALAAVALPVFPLTHSAACARTMDRTTSRWRWVFSTLQLLHRPPPATFQAVL